jgi:hypothetical protein
MSKQMIITVNPAGETALETSGFSGASCQDATRDFERALGVSSNETLTQEYYNTGTEEETVSE